MDRKRANRKLIRGLLIMTACSFAFGWALVPALFGDSVTFTDDVDVWA